MAAKFVHPTALVESENIGEGTRVWAYAHVLPEVFIGTNCNLGDHSFVETGARIGNNVTVKNNVSIWEGVTVEDDCFLGPSVVFTNDRFPRSPRMPDAASRYETRAGWLEETVVEQGCSIGANSIICPGIRLGKYSMIAAGSIVSHDVPPHALMMGVPARRVGTVCRCGLRTDDKQASNSNHANANEPPTVCQQCQTKAAAQV